MRRAGYVRIPSSAGLTFLGSLRLLLQNYPRPDVEPSLSVSKAWLTSSLTENWLTKVDLDYHVRSMPSEFKLRRPPYAVINRFILARKTAKIVTGILPVSLYVLKFN